MNKDNMSRLIEYVKGKTRDNCFLKKDQLNSILLVQAFITTKCSN